MNCKKKEAIISHRVYYNETDQMGRVYHANFIFWMEQGRTEWIREKWIPYKEIENLGFFLPIKDISLEYFIPVEYDEVVYIKTWAESVTRVKVEFSYEMTDESGEKLYAKGKSTNIFTGKDGKPKRINTEFFNKITEVV